MIKKLILLLVIGAIAASGAYYFWSINKKGDYSAQNFYIEKGDGAKEISIKLKDKKIIKDKNVFVAYATISSKAGKFIPGDHVLQANLNVKEIVDLLTSIDNINKEMKITILEGWSIKEIAKYLSDLDVVREEQFLQAADVDLWRDEYDFLESSKIKSLEGFLFPDTYRIFIGSSADNIIAKMLHNYDSKVTLQMRKDAESKQLDLNQIMTMASIIEKEAKYKQDKKMVADVFWKRIEIGMALQSDATVNYLTGKGETRSKGSDLEIDSPYNTYKYRGLPPGPICNPGIDSISAAIYPQANEYLYFITDTTGKAVYAKTFDEHKANIAKYLD